MSEPTAGPPFTTVFWNIGRRTTRDGIVRLVTGLQRDQSADVVALAECPTGVIGSVMAALNPIGRHPEWGVIPSSSRVGVVARTALGRWAEVGTHHYYSVFHVPRLVGIPLLIAVVHMMSRVEKEFDDVDEELGALGDAIRAAEQAVGHTNKILVGDLNANPFAAGVVSARGLHAVMPRAVAAAGTRRVSHRDYPYFFNPMWRFFGDGTTEPPGTFCYPPEGAHRAFHWNLFDQVLIRPALLPYYSGHSVRLIDTIARTRLTGTNNIPDRAVGSDHLPIRLSLTC